MPSASPIHFQPPSLVGGLNEPPAGWRHRLVALGLLVAGLIGTAIVAHNVKAKAEDASRRDFHFTGDEVALNIMARLLACEQILHSGAALFDALGVVDREKWRIFIQGLQIEKHLPGIQGVGVAEVIPRASLADHEQAIRNEGFPDYQFRPGGLRDLYSAIIYLEPFADRNLRAFGFDMLSEPVRRNAMERARDSHDAALSGKVLLMQETGTDVQAGTLLYLPIYRPGMPRETVEQRRAALKAWVYSPYRMTDLLRGALGEWNARLLERNIELQVYDGEAVSADQLLFDSNPASASSRDKRVQEVRLSTIEFAGRRWTLCFTQIGGLGATANYGSAWFALSGGAAISLLVFGLTLSLMRTRERAERTATRLTHELRETTERLELATRTGGVGVWDYDVINNHLVWDDQMFRLYNVTRDQFAGEYEAWQAGVHPDDRQRTNQEIQHALRNEAEFNTEFRVIWPDGSTHYIRAFGMVQTDASGRSVRMVGTNWDITKSKQTEMALQHTQARLTMAMNQARLAHWEMDAASETFTFNDAFYSLYGTTAEREGGYQMPVKTYAQEFLTPGEQHLVAALAARLLTGEVKEIRAEHRMVRRDGEIRYLTVNAVAIHNAAGQVVGLRGANQDITNLRLTEASLRESEEKFLAFMNALPAAAYIKDIAGRHLFMNDALRKMFGASESDYLGRTSAEYLPVGEATMIQAQEEKVQTSMRPLQEEQTLTIEGKERIFLTSNFPILRPGKEPLVGSIAVEITERRNSELALRRSEERFRSVVQAMSEGLVVRSADGAIIECNDQAERILGLTRQQLLGSASINAFCRTIREDGSTYPAEEHPMMISLRTGQRAADVVMGVHLAGKGLRWINLNAEPMMRPGESTTYAVVATLTDITERIEQQRKLKALLAQMEWDAKTKGDLLREVNHRVTNNLSSILGLFVSERRALDSAVRPAVQPVLDRLTQRIHGLLTAHRILSESQWTPVRVDKLAEKIVMAALSADPSYQKAQLSIEPSTAEVSPRQAGSLALVLNELTTNSVKHGRPQEQMLALEIKANVEDGFVILCYCDNGPGFPEDVIAGTRGNIGQRLIQQLVTGSLQGSLTMCNDSGGVVILRFPTEDLHRT